MTALLGTLPVLEWGSWGQGGACVAAVDLDKAYDLVARVPVDGILGYLSVMANPFYHHYC